MYLSEDTVSRITPILADAVAQGIFPGCTWAVGQAGTVHAQGAIGQMAQSPFDDHPMTLDTIFDLASLTKVVSTLPSLLLLVQAGAVHLEEPVATYLRGFTGAGKENVTLRHLLTHTGGLTSHRDFYRTLKGAELIRAAASEPLARDPGTRVEYSDLGFILLGEVVHVISGQSLDAFAEEHVFRPLGMAETLYRPAESLWPRIAPTEIPPGQERPKRGVVHDENAEAMGGVSGHAGLFAPLSDVVRYLTGAWLSDGLLSPWTREAALRCWTEGLFGRRGLGWVLRPDGYDPAGDLWPLTTFSHTGFTGTCVAADPVTGVWGVVLTNRVHFGRGTNIGPTRRRFYNAVAGCVRADR